MNSEIYDEIKKVKDTIDNALSYAEHHGRDGKWTYEMLIEAISEAKNFINKTFNLEDYLCYK